MISKTHFSPKDVLLTLSELRKSKLQPEEHSTTGALGWEVEGTRQTTSKLQCLNILEPGQFFTLCWINYERRTASYKLPVRYRW